MSRAKWSTRVGRAFGTLCLLTLLGVLTYAVAEVAGRLVLGAACLLLAVDGALVATNWRGVTAEFAAFFWTEQGINVPAPSAQARMIGVGAVVIGVIGGVGLLVSAFHPPGA